MKEREKERERERERLFERKNTKIYVAFLFTASVLKPILSDVHFYVL